MNEEIEVIINRGVWKLVPKPENGKVIGCRWVYGVKRNEEGEIVKYKARLVAQGFRQRKGIDYNEVFSPVVNFTIIRLFFSVLVSQYKWYHCQLDVKSAYLYAPLSETVYMDQPPGYQNSEKPHYVCRLDKALYGLHQSGREWFGEMHDSLEELKFQKLEWANCTYVLGSEVLLLLYVDDIVLFGRNKSVLNETIKKLGEKFDLKILGRTRKLLGVSFEEVENQLYIHQTEYINTIYKRFQEYRIPHVSLPIAPGIILSKDQCPKNEAEKQEMEKYPYRNVIGCLSFLASRTRPDISFAVNIFSQFQSNPGIVHWNLLLKLLGYVYQTRDLKLKLSNETYLNQLNINCFSDADFAANRDDRVSMGGLILFFGNVPIGWRAFKQKCVALSTFEAEFIALTEAAKELVWCIRVMQEGEKLNLFNEQCHFSLFCDNRAAIDFSNSPIENTRTKHIHVRYHFLKNLIKDQLFILKYVNTKNNFADVFTKPLTKVGLTKFVDKVFI